jgi:hypothetical protein
MSEDGNQSEMNASSGYDPEESPKSAPATKQIIFHPI